VSGDIGMRAVSSMFEDADAAVRFLPAGNDMMMICTLFTGTERTRLLARAILDARRSGTLDRHTLQRAHERIDRMLDHAAQHTVQELPDDTFRRRSGCGPFSGEGRKKGTRFVLRRFMYVDPPFLVLLPGASTPERQIGTRHPGGPQGLIGDSPLVTGR
jgi:hypothetical protein